MGMSSGSPSTGVRSEINIPPLVDVVLVLLIIFMVVTPLLQVGYRVEVPPAVESAAPPPEDQIVVRLAADGTRFLNATAYPSQASFGRALERAMKGRSDRIVFFAAEGAVPYGEVADFLDACRDHGAVRIGMVVDELAASASPEVAP